MQMKTKQIETRASLVREIIRMSQKALAITLALIGVGYIGGLVAICIRPELAEPLERFAGVFTPVWTLEIGMYGLGSTLENLQKARTQISAINSAPEDISNG